MNWEVTDYADFGKIMREEAIMYGIVAHVVNDTDEFEASIEMKVEPYNLVKTFRSKRSAKNWCERMVIKYGLLSN